MRRGTLSPSTTHSGDEPGSGTQAEAERFVQAELPEQERWEPLLHGAVHPSLDRASPGAHLKPDTRLEAGVSLWRSPVPVYFCLPCGLSEPVRPDDEGDGGEGVGELDEVDDHCEPDGVEVGVGGEGEEADGVDVLGGEGDMSFSVSLLAMVL